jgi:chemotaxis protein histidine kinase CheA
MKNGDLKEYIIPSVTKEEFMRRLQKAFSVDSQGSSAQAASASAASTSAQASNQQPVAAPVNDPAATITSENVRRILAERAARMKAEEEEAERLAEEKRAQAQEKAEADAAAGIQAAEKKKAKMASEYREKRKKAEEDRKRVLKRIEDDRKERRLRAEAREQERLANQGVGDIAASLVKSPETKLPSTSKPGAMTYLQVRLFDGSIIRSRFQTSAPLTDVRRWVDENRTDGKEPFTFRHLLTPLPSRTIDATEEEKTLGDLELAPSSTLVLYPVDKYSEAYAGRSSNIFMDFIRYILGLFTWIFGLLGLAGSRQAARASPAPEQAESTAASPDTSRIRGFQNPDDRRRDQQLYNGNSVCP